MDAKELIKGLSDTAFEEVANAVVLEAQERKLSIPALQTAGSLAVEGVGQFSSDDLEEALEDFNIAAETKKSVDARESILAQVPKTWLTYGEVKNHVGKHEDKASKETFDTELQAWLTEDKVDYVIKAQEADPELRFTLVATPNELVNLKQLTELAKLFGEEQPYPTYVYDDLLKKYTKEQLSGTNPDNGRKIVFSLIPSKLDDRLTGTVAKQKAVLAELKATELADLKVPSPLEAVAYWYTLRTNGKQQNNFGLTYIRHFDLPEKRIQDWQNVPSSYVNDYGEPNLRNSYADDDYRGRVVVG